MYLKMHFSRDEQIVEMCLCMSGASTRALSTQRPVMTMSAPEASDCSRGSALSKRYYAQQGYQSYSHPR